MNQIKFNLFPGGVNRCLTMSYDDGVKEDAQLIEIFNKYGIRGTFHVNSRRLFGYRTAEEVAALYAGHEISCHTVTHPFPDEVPGMRFLQEVLEDKRALEQAAGYVIRGMSYPQGRYNDEVIRLAQDAGMEYSRTVKDTHRFDLPADFLAWHPTCHHNDGILEKFEEFMSPDRYEHMRLLYIWGHSYEFPRDDNWGMMEAFCAKAGGRDDIWYATNIEIVDYINAMRGLKISADCDQFYNPAAVDVWFTVNDKKICCKAGQSASL